MKHYPFFTISGASGAGKTTLMEALIARFPEKFHAFESVTTREMRESDKDTYVHVSPEKFEEWEREGKFAWTADIHGIRYGTTRQSIEESLHDYRTSIFPIVPDIVAKLQEIVGKEKIFSIYILSCPPHDLRKRLTDRGDTADSIERRITDCALWDEQARKSHVPFHFVANDGTVEDLIIKVLKLLSEDGKTA